MHPRCLLYHRNIVFILKFCSYFLYSYTSMFLKTKWCLRKTSKYFSLSTFLLIHSADVFMIRFLRNQTHCDKILSSFYMKRKIRYRVELLSFSSKHGNERSRPATAVPSSCDEEQLSRGLRQ